MKITPFPADLKDKMFVPDQGRKIYLLDCSDVGEEDDESVADRPI